VPRVAKKKDDAPNAPALLRADEAVSALVASVVAANPRGAPITLPAEDNPTPLVEDAINAPPAEPIAPVRAPEAGPVCALDFAPKNSVLTMLQWPGESTKPVLMTPQGEQVVASNDYAQTLPRMAEIRRVGEVAFVARQLDDPIGHPDLVCTSAVECIRQFKKHFHGERE
jgi:hypothetical protein